MSWYLRHISPKLMLKKSMNRGFTLIEMTFTVLLACLLAYIAALNNRTLHQSSQVDAVLQHTGQLIITVQAYHRIYGRWPGGENCETALDEINQPIQGLEINGELALMNAYGSQLRTSCVPGEGNPFEITQAVDITSLDIFIRNLYDLSLGDRHNNLIDITTSVPTTESRHYIGVVEALFGESAFERLNLAANQAYFPLPEECGVPSQIEIAVVPQSLCLLEEPNVLNNSIELRLPLLVESQTEAVDTLNGEAVFTITSRLRSNNLHIDTQACSISNPELEAAQAAINCDLNSLDPEDTHGFLASVDWNTQIEYTLVVRLTWAGFDNTPANNPQIFLADSAVNFRHRLIAIVQQLETQTYTINRDEDSSSIENSDQNTQWSIDFTQENISNLARDADEIYNSVDANQLYGCPSMVTSAALDSNYQGVNYSIGPSPNGYTAYNLLPPTQAIPALITCSGH